MWHWGGVNGQLGGTGRVAGDRSGSCSLIDLSGVITFGRSDHGAVMLVVKTVEFNWHHSPYEPTAPQTVKQTTKLPTFAWLQKNVSMRVPKSSPLVHGHIFSRPLCCSLR